MTLDTARVAAELARLRAALAEANDAATALEGLLRPPAIIAPPASLSQVIVGDEWLTPSQIAGRIPRITEGHVRKVLKLGLARRIPGIRKDGGRWSATIAGFKDAHATCAF